MNYKHRHSVHENNARLCFLFYFNLLTYSVRFSVQFRTDITVVFDLTLQINYLFINVQFAASTSSISFVKVLFSPQIYPVFFMVLCSPQAEQYL